MAWIMNWLRKLPAGWISSPSQRWNVLPIRVIREIRGLNFGVWV